VDREHLPIILDLQRIEQSRVRAARPEGGKVVDGGFDCLLHACLRIAENTGNAHRCYLTLSCYLKRPTRVPIGSPRTARLMLPGTEISKTIMGRSFSMQTANAVRSMTR